MMKRAWSAIAFALLVATSLADAPALAQTNPVIAP